MIKAFTSVGCSEERLRQNNRREKAALHNLEVAHFNLVIHADADRPGGITDLKGKKEELPVGLIGKLNPPVDIQGLVSAPLFPAGIIEINDFVHMQVIFEGGPDIRGYTTNGIVGGGNPQETDLGRDLEVEIGIRALPPDIDRGRNPHELLFTQVGIDDATGRHDRGRSERDIRRSRVNRTLVVHRADKYRMRTETPWPGVVVPREIRLIGQDQESCIVARGEPPGVQDGPGQGVGSQGIPRTDTVGAVVADFPLITHDKAIGI